MELPSINFNYPWYLKDCPLYNGFNRFLISGCAGDFFAVGVYMAAHKNKININLVIRDGFDKSFSGQMLSWILTYGRYIIIITQIIVLSVFFLRFKIDRDHTDLQDLVSQKQAIVESGADLETEIRRIQGKLSYIRQISDNQDSFLKVLRFFQDHTPSDVTFSAFDLSATRINFSATAGDLGSFSFLLRQLQQQKQFSDVSLEDIQRHADGRIEFKINASINIRNFI